MATQIDARVKQKTGVAADFAGYNLLEGEIALVRTSASGPVWNFKVGPGNFDSLDWSLQNPGAAVAADTSTVFPSGVPGLYIPTEDGNYDGVTVDLTVGYVQLIWDGTTLVKVEFPIDLSGYATLGDIDGEIQAGETKAPNGDTVFSQLDPYLVLAANIPFELYAGDGTFTASGSYRPSASWVSTRLITIDPVGEQINIEGYQATGNKSVVFYTAADTLNQSPQYLSIPTGTEFSFSTPVGYSKMIVNVAAGSGVGSDIPNSPYWDTFKVYRGEERKIRTDMIKDRIDSDQLLTIESKINGLENAVTSFTGAGAPPLMYGLDNATYLDSVTGRLYTKINGLWDSGVTPLGFEFDQEYPPDFTWQPGVIYRQKNGAFCMRGYENITTIVQDTIRSMTPTFIDPVNGSDSNAGAIESPMKTIGAALGAGKRLIVLRGGKYDRTVGIAQYTDGESITDPLVMVPYQNEKVDLLSSDKATVFPWTADDNTYYTARTNVEGVINTDEYDLETGYKQYAKAVDLATCKSTSFSWYANGTSVWVNNGGLGVPGAQIHVMLRLTGYNTFTFNNAPFVYMEGIDLYVHSSQGSLCVRSNNTIQSNIKTYLKNMRGYDNRQGNIFSIESVKEAYVQNLYGWSSLRDAINYHTSYAGFEKMKFVEINCGSLDTGRNTTSEFSSNGSTAHDGIIGIRLGGSFDTARGGVVIDVNPGTYTLNYGVQAKNPMLPTGVTAAFQVQNDAVTRLFGCYAKGDRALTAETGSTMYVDSETVVQGSVNGNVIIES